jgi:NADP-reducing hydrogenase subunit HndD
MEAALRTAAETLTGKPIDKLEFEEVRGTLGIKEAVYKIAGLELRVAVASGLTNAKRLLENVKAGRANYHFIEIMACSGGCVNGGGQPTQSAGVRNTVDLKTVRAAALYAEDKNLPLRKSHENPTVKELYADYIEKPGSHEAHKVLHTHYVARKKY